MNPMAELNVLRRVAERRMESVGWMHLDALNEKGLICLREGRWYLTPAGEALLRAIP